MLSNFKTTLQSHLERSLKDAFPSHKKTLPSVELEVPADSRHGEFASNIAMKSSKIFKKSPMDLANEFLATFQNMAQDDLFKGKIAKI